MRYIVIILLILWSILSIKDMYDTYKVNKEYGFNRQDFTVLTSLWMWCLIVSIIIGFIYLCSKYW